MNETPSSKQLNPLEVIQALEGQVEALGDKVENLSSFTLNKDEAKTLHQNLVAIHNKITNSLGQVKSLNVDMIEEAQELAKEGSQKAIQAEMSNVREELQAATKKFAVLAENARDTTWLKRAYMGIGGVTLLGLALVSGAYAITSRHLSVSEKRAEVAYLDKSISDNWIIIEKQKLENDDLQNNVAQIKQEIAVIARFNESIEFADSKGGGLEIYLKEGWGTERCELASGSRVTKCIRRD